MKSVCCILKYIWQHCDVSSRIHFLTVPPLSKAKNVARLLKNIPFTKKIWFVYKKCPWVSNYIYIITEFCLQINRLNLLVQENVYQFYRMPLQVIALPKSQNVNSYTRVKLHHLDLSVFVIQDLVQQLLLDIFLYGTGHDLIYRPIMPQMNDFCARCLKNAPHDIDGNIMSIKQ